MSRVLKYLMAVTLLVLGGCATVSEDDSTFLIPPGSQVQLGRDINAPAGSRVYVQFGQLLDRPALDIHNPYCAFHMIRSPENLDTPFAIEKGSYRVIKSYHGDGYTGMEGVQFATTQDSNRALSTIMELASDQLEGQISLTCARWGRRGRDGYLTLSEMVATLDGVVKLVVAR